MIHDAAVLAQEPVYAGARPRIGLVLGGGGAKGAAHVGVLRMLEELRVPVDCIAGTSMGALVGAIYAAGAGAADIEQSMLAIDWTETIGGQGRRHLAPIQNKLTGRAEPGGLDIGVSKDGLTTSTGFVAAQDVEDTIRALVADSRFTQDFDDLPIPFRAVAADLVSGDMVVLDSGDLSMAMRASMSLPGIFAPVETAEGQLLADGGLLRNIPVDIARGLCADVVIAVWMSAPETNPEDLNSALAVLSRTINLMVEANETVQIESLTPSDVGIRVDVGDLGSEDFHRVAEAIEMGRNAAEVHREALARYSMSEEEFLAWQESVRTQPTPNQTISEIRIVGLDRVNPDFVRDRLRRLEEGAAVTSEDISGDMQRIFALGDFERVDYRLLADGDSKIIEIRPVEKSWGPNFLHLDAGLSLSGSGGIEALLRVDHDRTWMNKRGAYWHNAVQLGNQSLLQTDFYQPIDVRQRFFVHPELYFESSLEDLYDQGDRVARYRFSQLHGQVDVGMNFGHKAQVRLGIRRGWQEAELDTGIPELPELDRTDDASFHANFFFDTRDAVRLPTQGTFLRGRYMHSGSWLGGEQDYEAVEVVYSKTLPLDANSLSLIAGGADLLDGSLPINELIQLGGIRSFPGLRPGELIGDGYWFAGTSYSWRLAEVQPLFGEAIYGGLRVQAGRMYNRLDTGEDDTLYGVAGTITGRTPIGPFILSLGWVDIGGWRLQFSIGRPISEGSLLDGVY